ncbi:MAG: transcriptional regulator, partial [Acidimicrobiales bacterium]
SLLSAVDALEFSNLRTRLDVADSVLSKHISTLVEAGYATSRKESIGGRRTTWIALTRHGRTALRNHLAALQALIDSAQASPT